MGNKEAYEYAGFRYIIEMDEIGKPIRARPIDGQHSAASKEKHRRMALECFVQDNGIKL